MRYVYFWVEIGVSSVVGIVGVVTDGWRLWLVVVGCGWLWLGCWVLSVLCHFILLKFILIDLGLRITEE